MEAAQVGNVRRERRRAPPQLGVLVKPAQQQRVERKRERQPAHLPHQPRQQLLVSRLALGCQLPLRLGRLLLPLLRRADAERVGEPAALLGAAREDGLDDRGGGGPQRAEQPDQDGAPLLLRREPPHHWLRAQQRKAPQPVYDASVLAQPRLQVLLALSRQARLRVLDGWQREHQVGAAKSLLREQPELRRPLLRLPLLPPLRLGLDQDTRPLGVVQPLRRARRGQLDPSVDGGIAVIELHSRPLRPWRVLATHAGRPAAGAAQERELHARGGRRRQRARCVRRRVSVVAGRAGRHCALAAQPRQCTGCFVVICMRACSSVSVSLNTDPMQKSNIRCTYTARR